MWMRIHVHLTFEVLHNVQEDIVNIRPVMKLDFDGIQVAKCIRDIELTISSCAQTLRHGLGSCLDVIWLLCRR
jgi:hypothetical protein